MKKVHVLFFGTFDLEGNSEEIARELEEAARFVRLHADEIEDLGASKPPVHYFSVLPVHPSNSEEECIGYKVGSLVGTFLKDPSFEENYSLTFKEKKDD